MELKIIHNLTKMEYSLPISNVKCSEDFWRMDLVLPEGIVDGEYSYVLSDENITTVTGLLQIGDYVPEKQSYNEKEEYITYNGE